MLYLFNVMVMLYLFRGNVMVMFYLCVFFSFIEESSSFECGVVVVLTAV